MARQCAPYADRDELLHEVGKTLLGLAQSSDAKTAETGAVLHAKMLLSRERKLEELLKYLDKEYGFKTVYYPGSGMHQTPKNALGIDKVVHLSLEAHKGWPDGGYFEMLGEGIKVQGDYRHSPFKDKSFDAVFVYGTPLASTIEGLGEYRRVVKDDGLMVVVRHNKKSCTGKKDDFEIISEYLGDAHYPGGPHCLERIVLPQELENFGDTSAQAPRCPYLLKPRPSSESAPQLPDVAVFRNSKQTRKL